MMKYIREGDTLVIESYSKLARSTRDLLDIVERLEKMNVVLISDKEKVDTSTATGRLFFTMVAGLSQFEREIILERQREGIERAKLEGRSAGRPPVEVPSNFEEEYNNWKQGQQTATTTFQKLGLKKGTFYKLVKEHEEKVGVWT